MTLVHDGFLIVLAPEINNIECNTCVELNIIISIIIANTDFIKVTL